VITAYRVFRFGAISDILHVSESMEKLTEALMTRMFTRIFGLTLLLAAGLAGPSPLPAQDSPKQDIKDAGHDTKEAAKDTGRATKHAAKKTGRAVKKGTNKAAAKTEEGARKVKDKTDPN